MNACLFIFFQLKTIVINKNKSDNSVKNPAHPERSRSEFEAFSYSKLRTYLWSGTIFWLMCGWGSWLHKFTSLSINVHVCVCVGVCVCVCACVCVCGGGGSMV